MHATISRNGAQIKQQFNDNEVELIGHYGSDYTHALSAWTSTRRELTEEREGRIGTLLEMLAQNGHHTPFEKSYLHFIVTCDTASHIHLLKHRIGVSVNGESARYKELDDKAYIPTDWPDHFKLALTKHIESSQSLYHRAVQLLEPKLGRKRAKESARFYLPYANQLTLDVGFNFRSFMYFQQLRNEEGAQKEIRDIAQHMLALVYNTNEFALSLKAFGYA